MNNKIKNVKRIIRVSKSSDDVQYHLEQAQKALTYGDYTKYESEMKASINAAEQTVLDAKSLVKDTIKSPKKLQELEDEELDIMGISVEKIVNDVIKITMPPILPFHFSKEETLRSKKYGDVSVEKISKRNLVLQMVERAVENYLEEHPEDIGSIKDCSIFCLNVFEKGFFQDRIPDTDNYSYKFLSDLITSTFCSGDRAGRADFYIKNQIDDSTRTEIYVIPKRFNFDFKTGDFN